MMCKINVEQRRIFHLASALQQPRVCVSTCVSPITFSVLYYMYIDLAYSTSDIRHYISVKQFILLCPHRDNVIETQSPRGGLKHSTDGRQTRTHPPILTREGCALVFAVHRHIEITDGILPRMRRHATATWQQQHNLSGNH